MDLNKYFNYVKRTSIRYVRTNDVHTTAYMILQNVSEKLNWCLFYVLLVFIKLHSRAQIKYSFSQIILIYYWFRLQYTKDSLIFNTDSQG